MAVLIECLQASTVESIRLYQYNLDSLYDALPVNKQIREGTLAWGRVMIGCWSRNRYWRDGNKNRQ